MRATSTAPLLAGLRDRIVRSGPISYADYIETCLYDAEHGYYLRGDSAPGRRGDYFTAPVLGPLFGVALSRYIVRCLERTAPGPLAVIEVGAGDGRLLTTVAAAVLSGTKLPVSFVAVERSPARLDAIRARFSDLGFPAPAIARSIRDIAAPVRGVVFSNELLDAMPVHVVEYRDGWHEMGVGWKGQGLVDVCLSPLPDEVAEYVTAFVAPAGGPPPENGFRLEVNLAALRFVEDVAARLQEGVLITVDYGGALREILPAAGAGGTLRAFYRHTVTGDVLSRPGQQDLTHTVNFTPIVKRGIEVGFGSRPLVTQAVFLLANAASDDVPPDSDRSLAALKARLRFKTLVSPSGLGEQFKVLVQGKGLELPAIELPRA